MDLRTKKARPPRVTGRLLLPALAVLTLAACGSDAGEGTPENTMSGAEADPAVLGPVDGSELPATDLERVAVGSVAPDFSLRTLEGDTVTLSSFRGSKDVVLVFYRGHW